VVNLVEGENDGLVTPDAARWTNFRGVLRGSTNRGISHADEVDARRMNFSGKQSSGRISDIRAFYADTVAELKEMGF
jgi:triacylglycerol lipase